jgi:hypothetical protein
MKTLFTLIATGAVLFAFSPTPAEAKHRSKVHVSVHHGHHYGKYHKPRKHYRSYRSSRARYARPVRYYHSRYYYRPSYYYRSYHRPAITVCSRSGCISFR